MCFGRHLKNGRHSHNFFRILSNFEIKLEIPNIMLVCKFEINWSTNKNLRALTTYLGWMPCISISPAPLCGGGGQKRVHSTRSRQ